MTRKPETKTIPSHYNSSYEVTKIKSPTSGLRLGTSPFSSLQRVTNFKSASIVESRVFQQHHYHHRSQIQPIKMPPFTGKIDAKVIGTIIGTNLFTNLFTGTFFTNNFVVNYTTVTVMNDAKSARCRFCCSSTSSTTSATSASRTSYISRSDLVYDFMAA